MTQPPADALASLIDSLVEAAVARAVDELADRMPFLDPMQALSVDEAAAVLRVSRRSMYRIIAHGDLPVMRMEGDILRIRRSSLDEWMRAHEQGGQPCPAPESEMPVDPIPLSFRGDKKTRGRQVIKERTE